MLPTGIVLKENRKKNDPKEGGIRIRHKTLKGVMLVVRDQSRPIPHRQGYVFPKCATCGYPHDVKTYHLQLDSEGTIIVSLEIYRNLQRLVDHAGFDFANHVSNPPTQIIKPQFVDQKAKAFDPEPIRRDHVHGD
jgi:hypothetical protein